MGFYGANKLTCNGRRGQKEITLMVNTQAIVRPDYSGLSMSLAQLADSILSTAEGKVLRCGDKRVVLTGDLSSDRRAALKLAGKLR